jgi:tRNA pseudouridine38-40 synthase
MRVVRLTLAYDGTDFRGWARQRDRSIRTVEGVVTDLLSRVVDEPIRLSVAGRTDAGVHARGQVASFRTRSSTAPARIREALNAVLGPEVVALDVRDAPTGFDARFSASAREYRYVVVVDEVPDPFTTRFEWYRPGVLSVPRMREAARSLTGSHDFSSFCRHPGMGKPTVRDLQRVRIVRNGARVVLGFRANAFLHQMVRSIVATLVAVGEGRLEPADVGRMLAAHDRSASRGLLAPARGLTLERVIYGRRSR